MAPKKSRRGAKSSGQEASASSGSPAAPASAHSSIQSGPSNPPEFGAGERSEFSFSIPSPPKLAQGVAPYSEAQMALWKEAIDDIRREAEDKYYNRVHYAEAKADELREELAETHSSTAKLKKEISSLNSMFSKVEEETKKNDTLIDLNHKLLNQIHELRTDRDLERATKKELLDCLDKIEGENNSRTAALERMKVDHEEMAEALRNLMPSEAGPPERVDLELLGNAEEMNCILDEPVLVNAAQQLAIQTNPSLSQELSEVGVDSFSQDSHSEDGEGGDHRGGEKEKKKSARPHQRDDTKQDETLGFSPIKPLMDEQRNPKQDMAPGPSAILPVIGKEPNPTSFGSIRGGVARRRSPVWLTVLCLLLHALLVFVTLLSNRERHVWRAANSDTVGLAWASKGGSSLWVMALMELGGTSLSGIQPGMYG